MPIYIPVANLESYISKQLEVHDVASSTSTHLEKRTAKSVQASGYVLDYNKVFTEIFSSFSDLAVEDVCVTTASIAVENLDEIPAVRNRNVLNPFPPVVKEVKMPENPVEDYHMGQTKENMGGFNPREILYI